MKKNKNILTVSNDTEKVYVASKKKNKFNIFISSSEEESLKILNDAKTLFSHALYFPAKDIFFYNSDVASTELIEQRLEVIEAILSNEEIFISTTIEAAIEKLSNLNNRLQQIINIYVGDSINIDELQSMLINAGYERYSKIYGKGQFSIRGAIIDIYSYTMKNPIRIELFDDEVDSIREFDIESQRSINSIDSCKLFIGNDNEKNTIGTSLIELAKLDEYSLFINESEKIEENINRIYDLYHNDSSFISKDELINILNNYTSVNLSVLDIDDIDADINSNTLEPYDGNIYKMIYDIKEWHSKNYEVSIYTASYSRANRILDELVKENISSAINPEEKTEKIVTINTKSINNSFILFDSKKVFISDTDIFKKFTYKRRKIKREDSEEIRSFSDLKIGDVVVHDKYGIGIYRGIENIAVNGINKDHLAIEYKNNSVLHVLATNLNTVQKYIGNIDTVKINDINSDRWRNSTNKVRQKLEIIAKDLVELYAKRENEIGFKFSKDSELQKEMEELFEYVETDDQIQAINEIKSDMESKKVMDRLLCGDVGFGKTEVAIRAAFKAVLDNKQVVVLVPTTILAKQHYNVFRERLKNFPVNISMLSRFVTTKQTKQIIDDVNNGKCDILIGTHATLKKEIVYKDLGLLIVDEEQRFGVTHKEKIKNLKNNVDVLTLSATPIPRTLHMSLSGIRDLSILNEAPYDRQSVQTYVLQYKEELIKEAILREINRGGQVYFIHNRVNNIDEMANSLRKLVPGISVEVVHGQMSKKNIEEIFLSFNEREIDVLVATTIVETGLDIPNVNTIIINNADQFGLATLYQLRGRVGRSSRKAYAFLTYPKGKNLSSESAERLKAIREFTKLGSGAKIAMRDMQIRGVGSILGNIQHGHIEAIGYEMYCKILKETLAKINGNKSSNNNETFIDIDIDAHIENEYIKTESEKLEIYKKINTISTEADIEDIIDECIDRYGEIPKELMNIIKTSYIKNRANKLGIKSIIETGNAIEIKFSDDVNININYFIELIQNNPITFNYKADANNLLICNFKENKLEQLKQLVEGLDNKNNN